MVFYSLTSRMKRTHFLTPSSSLNATTSFFGQSDENNTVVLFLTIATSEQDQLHDWCGPGHNVNAGPQLAGIRKDKSPLLTTQPCNPWLMGDF